MKKRRYSNFQKVLALALGLASIGGTVQAKDADLKETKVEQQSRKDQVQVKHTPVRPESRKRNFFGASDENPFKHNRTPKKNQRQRRKFLRQNPHVRAKYK